MDAFLRDEAEHADCSLCTLVWEDVGRYDARCVVRGAWGGLRDRENVQPAV